MSNYYTKEQMDAAAEAIGGAIKDSVVPAVEIVNEMGDSEVKGVSQKLFTDTVGDIDSILLSINGE